MILSAHLLQQLKETTGVDVPAARVLSLPEKVLQFGTGVLLRGLPDYFIDKANKQHLFNGRVVMVKSTSHGEADSFAEQDNLYTQLIRGIANGQQEDKAVINASVSRVLTAAGQWNQVLACAANPQLQIIISNTTEVGIVLHDQDDVNALPPVSFPGKLLAFLQKRFEIFNGSTESGMVIIPTELVVENGAKLKAIVLELAKQNRLEPAFLKWIDTANDFCNSLVDRIVPGPLLGEEKAAAESKLGYKDNLMIVSEVYRLWAIETSEARTENILSFSQADKGVVITHDINKFRELKLRLLNGSHTFSCAVAVLMGFATVKEAMQNKLFLQFISSLMTEEIVPALAGDDIPEEEAKVFAAAVLDRFKNPFIEHQWLSISLQYSSKMKLRNIPLLQQYVMKTGIAPRYMALGFAAYLLFMKSNSDGSVFTGSAAGTSYIIHDDKAAVLHQCWLTGNTGNFVEGLLAKTDLWGINLNNLAGFCAAVTADIESIQQNGIGYTLEHLKK